MDTFSEHYLRRRLKGLAHGPQPPADLRERLLEKAARSTRRSPWFAWLDPEFSSLAYPGDRLGRSQNPLEWLHVAFRYDVVHSFRSEIFSPRLII